MCFFRFVSRLWMTPQMTGVSRWNGSRSRTSNYLCSFRGPWLLRQRPAARPEPRCCTSNTNYHSYIGTVLDSQFTPPCLFASSTGDRGRGRDECVPRSERSLTGNRRVAKRPAASLPADSQHHRSREELHHHFPTAVGHDTGSDEALIVRVLPKNTNTFLQRMPSISH